MYNPIKTIKSVYRNYDTGTGTAVLAIGGAVIGCLAGVVLPFYIGWEIGEYVKNALEFGAVAGTITKSIGAIGLTSLVAGATVPAGIIGGASVGGAIGFVGGKVKEGLEDYFSH